MTRYLLAAAVVAVLAPLSACGASGPADAPAAAGSVAPAPEGAVLAAETITRPAPASPTAVRPSAGSRAPVPVTTARTTSTRPTTVPTTTVATTAVPTTTARTTAAPATIPTTPASSTGSGFSALLLAAALAGCVLCLGVGWLTGRRSHRASPPAAPTGRTTPSGAAGPPPVALAPTAGGAPGRDDLADEVIAARDGVQDPALAARLDAALARAGYRAIDPVGQAFDPAYHRVVDFAAAPEPGLIGRVAATERVGYTGSGRVVRVADVVVFRGVG